MNEITNFRGEVIPDERLTTRSGDIDAFVAAVGERVRKARQRKGIARRVPVRIVGRFATLSRAA